MSQGLSTEVDELPDITNLAIEDDTPVDNLISEKQQRLLTERQRAERLAERLRSLGIDPEA